MISDEIFMARALHLAELAGVDAAPNPLVGAVIVHDGKIIGEGYHQRCGEAHAEVNAIADVKQKDLIKEATIYVTLEPCAHFGKTPPCAELLVKHQFKRVVVATLDPFTLVAGKGIALIQAAGIEITVGVLEQKARYLNRRFFTFHEKKRPFIILKWAQTKDGFIDSEREEEETASIRWISAPETQVFTHQLRTKEQGILVGWKTVLNDNPSLTARAFHGPNPIRIVIDPQLKAPQTATVFTDGFPTVVLNALQNKQSNSVQYIQLADFKTNTILTALFELKLLSVIIEGGRFTLQQFIDENKWDEAIVIQGKQTFQSGTSAPKLSGIPQKTVPFGEDRIHFYTNL